MDINKYWHNDPKIFKSRIQNATLSECEQMHTDFPLSHQQSRILNARMAELKPRRTSSVHGSELDEYLF